MATELSEIKEILKELSASQKETDAMFKETRALFKELFEAQKEAQKETDAMFKETDAKFKETSAMLKEFSSLRDDVWRQFRETDKQIAKVSSEFTSKWGKLVETLVAGDLVDLLRERGVAVNRLATRQRGSVNGQNFEFDIVAMNGNEIVVVEVKSTLKVHHIKHFIKQIKRFKEFYPEYQNYKIYGAVAYLHVEEKADAYAENQALLVIRATGDSASITNEEGFIPRAF